MSSLLWLTEIKFTPRSGSMKYIAIGICNTQQFGSLLLTKICVLSVYPESIFSTPPPKAPPPSRSREQWTQTGLERREENLLESLCTRKILIASFPSSNALCHFSRQRYFLTLHNNNNSQYNNNNNIIIIILIIILWIKSISRPQCFCPGTDNSSVLQNLIKKKTLSKSK